MKLLASFLLVLSAGVMANLFISIPFLKPQVAAHSDLDVRIMRGALLITPVISSLISILLWIVESSIASLILRRVNRKREARLNLKLVMEELSLAYIPVFAFLLIVIPLVWFNLPDYTVTSAEGLITAAQTIGGSPLYVNVTFALLAVSLSRYPMYAIILRYRLGTGWKTSAFVVLSLLLVDAIVAWAGGLGKGVGPA